MHKQGIHYYFGIIMKVIKLNCNFESNNSVHKTLIFYTGKLSEDHVSDKFYYLLPL